MKEYKSRTFTVQSMLYLREDNIHQVLDFANEAIHYHPTTNEYYLTNPEGVHELRYGNIIVKEDDGNFYIWNARKFNRVFESI